jgi:hypothetical protein
VLNRTTVKLPDVEVCGEVQVFACDVVGKTPMRPNAKTLDTTIDMVRFDLV